MSNDATLKPPHCWLWPDHTIGERESRTLREEHNALANDYDNLKTQNALILRSFNFVHAEKLAQEYERDELKAVNAEMLEALEALKAESYSLWIDVNAAIANAKGE